jgi:hypothetical protein
VGGITSFNFARYNENITGIISEKGAPSGYSLSQNYPNPFNPTTTIEFSIPQAGNISLKLFDVIGNEVTIIANEYLNSGNYNVNFNGSELASGVYIYRIQVNDFVSSKKLMLLK